MIRLRSTVEAKRLGGLISPRPGWDGAKLDVMEDLVRRKFSGRALGGAC